MKLPIFLLCALVWPALVRGQQGTQEIKHLDTDGPGAVDASVTTRTDARTLTLAIPAPRGLITDRFGYPLAQNRVGYQFALQFEHFEKPTDAAIVAWARIRLAHASKVAQREYTVSDQNLLEHYRHRRWLPLIFSSLLDPSRDEAFKKDLMPGLIMHPFYYRHYPEKETAGHILGYVRSKGKLPTGPIVHGDFLFEDTYGDAGLEETLNQELTGVPGERKVMFDSDGSQKRDEITKRPRIGNTVVTTLNLAWQKHAESVLRKSCKRGAFVVIDIPTGEVLVLASQPSYDINVWIPRISEQDLQALQDDESAPMFGRAFQGQYPPASSFKPVVALTALTNDVVQEWTKIDCPVKLKIGDKWFRNHSEYPDGPIDVARALARSNNCWFYQVGIKTRPSAFLSTARRLGFGSKTGLPLFGESPGRVPTNEWVLAKFGRSFTEGDAANFSIGQAWEATPLQVAQAMAGIANGSVLPRLHLIRQVQDCTGGVLRASEPEARNTLSLDPDAVKIVHKGMMQVVHASYGTGKRGALSFTTLAAKTGTAQWNNDRDLAWFAGFFPYENPRLAFVALYEGSPGEVVSGGKKAAPMIPRFFESLKDEIKDMIKPPSKALIVDEEVGGERDPARAEPVPEPGEGEGKLSTPNGKILRAIPVEPLELDEDPEEPAEDADGDGDADNPAHFPPPDPNPGEALPAIPVDDAPVAVPVEEDDE